MISKLIVGRTELMLRDDWPEFPTKPGTYHIAIIARDDAGNESDPLLLIGSFGFIAPATPSKGGVDTFASTQPLDAPASISTGEVTGFPLSDSGPETPDSEPEPPDHFPASNTGTLISRGMEGVINNEEIGDAYFPQRAGEIHKIAVTEGEVGMRGNRHHLMSQIVKSQQKS